VQLVLLFILALAQESPQVQDISVDSIITLLKVRDESLSTIVLPFSAITNDRSGKLTAEYDGLWARQGQVELVRQEVHSHTRGSRRLSGNSLAIWDGSTARIVGFGPENTPRGVEIRRGRPTQFFSIMPSNCGLAYAGHSWSAYLESYPKTHIRIEGIEEINGRKCQRIVLRSFVDVDKWAPLVLWVDTGETLLVWKFAQLARKSDYSLEKQEDLKGEWPLEMTIDNEALVSHAYWEVLEASKVGKYWIPSKVRNVFVAKSDRGNKDTLVARSQTIIRVDGVLINAPMPNELKDIPDSELHGVRIDDRILDRSYYLNPLDGELSAEEKAFEAVLERFASEFGLRVGKRPPDPQGLLSASCGPRSLYALLRLRGGTMPLEVLTNAEGPPLSAGWTLSNLKAAASRLGTDLKALQLQSTGLTQIRGFFIAHVKELRHAGENEGVREHFVLAKSLENDKVRIFAPPSGISEVSRSDFSKLTTGNVLVPSDSIGSAGTAAENNGQPPRNVGALVLVGSIGCGALIIGTILFLRRRPGTAAIVLLLPGLLNAVSCNRSLPPSPIGATNKGVLKVLGGSTRDFGSVDEGTPLFAEFKITNTSTQEVALSARGSCGCSGVFVKPSRLAPGQVGAVGVTVVTIGRSGGFNDFVDVRSGENRLATLWLVGSVTALLRLRSNPSVIELGTMRVGESKEVPVVVNAAVSGDSIDWTPTAEYTGQGPLNWTSGWTPLQSAKSTAIRTSQVAHGKLLIDARHTGDVRTQAIDIIARGASGRTITFFRIKLRGAVTNGLDVRPSSVFLGNLQHRISSEFSLVIQDCAHCGPSNRAPVICDLPPWIQFVALSRQESSYLINLRASAPDAAAFQVCTFNIKRMEGSEERTVPVKVAAKFD